MVSQYVIETIMLAVTVTSYNVITAISQQGLFTCSYSYSLSLLSGRTSQFHTCQKQSNQFSQENKINAHLIEKAISFK